MINSPSIPNSSIVKFSKCVNYKITLSANVATAILNTNAERMYAAFINNSQSDITLVLEDKSKAVIDSGIILKGNGGSYEINLVNLYTGKISAISANTEQLSFVECSS